MTDEFGVKLAEDYAQCSQDESRKSGCIIAIGDHLITSGANNFPPGVARTDERLQRPAKYTFTEHAERTAIYLAAKVGVALAGSTAYLNWYPCADCARALAMSGIIRLVCVEPDWTEVRYGFHDARAILEESGVKVTYVGKKQEVAK
jgi:dCMP deaminase